MSEIYWITRMDGINSLLITLSIICGIVVFFAVVFYCIFRDEYEQYGRKGDKNWMEFLCKMFKISTPTFVLLFILTILTPTTKETMLIYGVGTTIDYVKQNNTLKQIPDKCIEALDAWVDSFVNEDEDK